MKDDNLNAKKYMQLAIELAKKGKYFALAKSFGRLRNCEK
jgi:hypothetical protein